MRTIAVVGAGGFAREVRWLIDEINRREERYRFLGYIVSDLESLGGRDSTDEVLGDYGWIGSNRVDCLAVGIGNPGPRLRVARELVELFPAVEWPALVHPSVVWDQGSGDVGQGVLMCAGTVGTVNLRLEPFSMVNLCCTLGHEAVIGVGSVLNPTVNISGGVELGEGVLVGTGAQVLQYVRVGDGAVVGAGAVVTKDVEPGSTVVGVPA